TLLVTATGAAIFLSRQHPSEPTEPVVAKKDEGDKKTPVEKKPITPPASNSEPEPEPKPAPKPNLPKPKPGLEPKREPPQTAEQPEPQPAPVSGDLIRQLGTRVSLSSAALSPDGNTAVAVSSSVLQVWDLKAGRQLRGVGGGTVYQEVVFLPDGRRLLARGGRVADGKFEPALQLVDSQTGQRLREFTGHTKAIQCM